MLILFLLVLFAYYLLLPLIILIWYTWYVRSKKKSYVHSASKFNLPRDENGNILKPAIVGDIERARLNSDDVIATIFDLAIKKYLRMDEKDTKEKAFGVFDKTVNRLILTRLKNPDEQLDNYEKILMDRLFITGDSIIINNLLWDFVDTFHKMEKNVIQILLERKYYARNPWKQKILLIILAIASCVFTYNFFLTLVILFLSKKLHGRTALGDKIAFNIDELKLFIKSIDENYSLQKDRFNIAEQIIPYAVSLGFIDKYLEQLKIISPDYNPAWLTGNIDVSSLYYFLMACIDSSGGGIRGNAGIYATGESGV